MSAPGDVPKFLIICNFKNLYWRKSRVSSRTVPSREVLGRSRDETGQDLETLKVPAPKSPRTKEFQKSQDFRAPCIPRVEEQKNREKKK